MKTPAQPTGDDITVEHAHTLLGDYILLTATHDDQPTGASLAIPMSRAFDTAREIAMLVMAHTPTQCDCDDDCDCPHPAYMPEEDTK